METLGKLPRRLTKLYSDTKHSCDVVTKQEKVGNVPELLELHLGFRIQRERLSAWGLEWSDDNAKDEGSIDEAVAREGLTETVTSVLNNIQDVTEEAERIRCLGAFKGREGLGSEKSRMWREESVTRWSPTDYSRYEQLAKDLTTAIDLLYDLSRTRRELRQGTYPSGSKGKADSPPSAQPPPTKATFYTRDYSISEETLVNPTRTSTSKTIASLELPSRLDPSLLDLPEEEPPPYDSIGATVSSRMIAYLRQPALPSASSSTDDSAIVKVPVLVEFAPFDPAYRATGVSPPTQRLDALLAFYARSSITIDNPASGTLSCLGFFEDPKEPRFGLVYELPKAVTGNLSAPRADKFVRPTSLLKVLQASSRALNSHSRMLPPGPALEDRFRLAFSLVQAFSKMHTEERFVHKDLNSGNIIFFPKPSSRGDSASVEYDIRTPYISSFDLFTDFNLEKLPTTPARNIYRHRDDPRISQYPCGTCSVPSCTCSPFRFDVHALGLLLLEVGLWSPLADLYKSKYTLDDFKQRIDAIWVKRLAPRCGKIYMEVVRDMLCESSGNITEETQRACYDRWLSRLRRCCLLDEADDVSHEPTGSSSSSSGTQSLVHSVILPLPSLSRQSSSSRSSLELPRISSLPINKTLLQNQSLRPTSLPFAINESEEDLTSRNTRDMFQSSEDLVGTSLSARADSDNTSTSSKYYSAAQTIQRAWRARCCKGTFKEYRAKVSVIQAQWRMRKMRLAGAKSGPASTASQVDDDVVVETELIDSTSTEHTVVRIDHGPIISKPRLRIHNVKVRPELLEEWHQVLQPRLERIVERALRDSPESCNIDLVMVGETALTAKPTIFITCTSTARVRGYIARKFSYDHDVLDVKVRRGKIRRSKAQKSRQYALPHRSMAPTPSATSDQTPLNPFHQQRPLCGASIGAFVGKHLPPVSFGGVVDIDGELFGMTVHHLLDDPSDDDEDSEYGDDPTTAGAVRSSGRRTDLDNMLQGAGSHPSLQTYPTDSMFPLEISDDDEQVESDDEVESFDFGYSSEDERSQASDVTDESGTQGDTNGVTAGSRSDILITQPALDDVDEDFFPCIEDRDEDHLDSHTLGHVYASSGIRRWNRRGIVHEIDWALLRLDDDRMQPCNLIQGGKRFCTGNKDKDELARKLVQPVCRGEYDPAEDEFPNEIAKAEDIGNLPVHCFGRTSGLQGGVVGPAMSSVRIYKRRSFSRSWYVIGDFGGNENSYQYSSSDPSANSSMQWAVIQAHG